MTESDIPSGVAAETTVSKAEFTPDRIGGVRRVIRSEGSLSLHQEAMQQVLDATALTSLWAQRYVASSITDLANEKIQDQILAECSQLSVMQNAITVLRTNIITASSDDEIRSLVDSTQSSLSGFANSIGIDQWPPSNALGQDFNSQPLDIILKREVIANYCHDIKTGPAILVGWGSLSRDSRSPDPQGDREMAAEVYQKTFREMAEMSRQNYEALEKGIPVEPVSIIDINNAIENNFQEYLWREAVSRGSRDIKVTLKQDEGSTAEGNVLYNNDLLDAVFKNAAQNAVKAVLAREEVPEEGLQIEYGVHVVDTPDGTQKVELVITDNGIGLRDPEQVRFDFVEGDTKWDANGKVKGTGEGMASLAALTKSDQFNGDLYLRKPEKSSGSSLVLELDLKSH